MKHFRTMCLVAVAATMMTACKGGGNDNEMVGWVDLGLPSGLLWATCNVGASAPEEVGNFYAWGEVEAKPKDGKYDWESYRYAKEGRMTKYCFDSTEGYNDYVDSIGTLEPMDDAATQAIGNGARTPTIEEWIELLENTTIEMAVLNGVRVFRFTAENENSLYLPVIKSMLVQDDCSGDENYEKDCPEYIDESTWYWSSTNILLSGLSSMVADRVEFLNEYRKQTENDSVDVKFTGHFIFSVEKRCNVKPIRAVREGQKK